MSLALLHTADPRPALAPLAGLTFAEWSDPEALARLTGRADDAIAERLAAGHRAFVASLEGAPAAYGWVATRSASLGELGITLRLPARDRYLWNFVTLPPYRGRGIYPRLLAAILSTLQHEGAWHVWIAYAPENHASATGIARAGFAHVADLSFAATGAVAFRERVAGAGHMVAPLLGIPATDGALTPCWRCVRAGRDTSSCAADTCRCDYQRPDTACADVA